MNYKYSCVIDKNNAYKTFVLILIETDNDGTDKEVIQHYHLQEGETLLAVNPPNLRVHAGSDGLIKPIWKNGRWEEGLTKPEIQKWEKEHPSPEPPAPSASEKLRADVDFIAAMTGVEL